VLSPLSTLQVGVGDEYSDAGVLGPSEVETAAQQMIVERPLVGAERRLTDRGDAELVVSR
jgi:hypothetical protein